MDITDAELELVGRLVTASNGTYLARLGDRDVVYKPIAGERPLWDFPDGTLAGREVATYLLSSTAGWDLVPRTWIGDGPFGAGMVQEWVHADPEPTLVDIVPTGRVPQGWLRSFDGYDATDRPVSVVHADLPAMRRIAVFDVLVNNADRKGSHLLASGDRVLGVDHGLSFHVDPKLRTVLWGWRGAGLSAEETELVRATRAAVTGPLAEELGRHLAAEELDALVARCDRLLAVGVLPSPTMDRPAVPWPPL